MAAVSKILVTGSKGQLGNELQEMAALYPKFQFVFFDSTEAPINDDSIMKKVFEMHKPDFLVNCAAYTAVDKAEAEKDKALAVNGKAVGIIAALCKEYKARFIHISTDYVFDGNGKKPIKENDKVNPVNYYGTSKLSGEELAFSNNPDTIIIRTSWVYSFYGKNFVKTMIRLMNEKENIQVVNDQYGSPTYAADLAQMIMDIIISGNWTPGIFHFSNEGIISWYDFALEIKSLIHSDCNIQPIPTTQFPTPAKRPHYSALDKTKIQQVYNAQLKGWKESLHNCIQKINTHISQTG